MTTAGIILLSVAITTLFVINISVLFIAFLVYRELNNYGKSVAETKGLLLKLIMDSNILTQSIYSLSAVSNDLGELLADFSVQLGSMGPPMDLGLEFRRSEGNELTPLFSYDPDGQHILDKDGGDKNDPLDTSIPSGYTSEKGELDTPRESDDIIKLRDIFEKFLEENEENEENEEEDLEA